MTLAFILLILFNLFYNGNNVFIIDPSLELIGTWTTIPNDDRFNPRFRVVISNDSILISRKEFGGSGYDQLLSYNLKNDTLFARELEYMSFDLNVGSLTRHFKNRNKIVHLILYGNKEERKLILYPLQPGTVFKKESNISTININFNDELSKWRLSHNFKSDYRKNGRPITLTSRKRVYELRQ